MAISSTGRPLINPGIVIGSHIIKHLCNLDDRETVDQISENLYIQYFLGHPSFSYEVSLKSTPQRIFRKGFGFDQSNAIDERIVTSKVGYL